MGNRAVLALNSFEPDSIGICLHWHGSLNQVQSFLDEARALMGDRISDEAYTTARLIQIIGQNIDGNLSFGVDLCQNLDTDNGDNGTYTIDLATLTIKRRQHHD